MSEEWIVRVQGREYGPVDLETLREWKTEGRVVPANEARKVDVDLWTSADQIPGLFAPVESIVSSDIPIRQRSLREILVEAWRIYRRGFWQFLCLSALVIVPWICLQLTSAAVGPASNIEVDFRILVAAAFNFCMFLLVLASWPVYVAGIQLLTAELTAGRVIGIAELFQRSLKFWPRVALLCVVVYGVFFLLILFAFGILVMIVISASSLLLIFLALVLLVLQAWMFARWFINVLFWQQFTVLGESDPIKALRQSRRLARSGRDLPWFRRPLWRGAFLVSVWFVFVATISLASDWSLIQRHFHEIGTTPDAQTLWQSLSEYSRAAGFDWLGFTLWLAQKILQPLLGIAFVLLYFESKIDKED
jgi:hypothetical protein